MTPEELKRWYKQNNVLELDDTDDAETHPWITYREVAIEDFMGVVGVDTTDDGIVAELMNSIQPVTEQQLIELHMLQDEALSAQVGRAMRPQLMSDLHELDDDEE